MSNSVNFNKAYFPTSFSRTSNQKTLSNQAMTGNSFENVLKESIEPKHLQFSHHAAIRMQGRGITLSPDQIKQLEDAVDKVSQKGGKDTLVIMKNTAFIVNAPNKVVVTAIDNQSLKDHVFTQIDSTIVI
jgi:flagellar operon protein